MEKRLKGDSKNLLYIIQHLISLNPENKNIRAVYRHLNQHPGKLLRPSILFLLCHEYQVKISPDILLAALVIEIMHNAALLQDDVFDNERTRRKKPSPNTVFGDTRTILTGDYLIVKSMDMLQGVENEKIRRIIYKAAYTTCSGEMDNCDMDIPDKISMKRYMSIIEQKTASLFRVCGEIVNIQLKKKKEEIVSFPENFGILYQIMDDLTDAESLLISKRTDYTLKDIVCLPLIYLMNKNKNCIPGKNNTIDSKRILMEMKKENTYEQSLNYIRKRFGTDVNKLKKKNELLYLILKSLYQNTENFLRSRCEG